MPQRRDSTRHGFTRERKMTEKAAWEAVQVHLKEKQKKSNGYGICFAIWDMADDDHITVWMRERMVNRLPKRRVAGFCWPTDDLGIRLRFCHRMFKRLSR
jgi:hypothetical protein